MQKAQEQRAVHKAKLLKQYNQRNKVAKAKAKALRKKQTGNRTSELYYFKVLKLEKMYQAQVVPDASTEISVNNISKPKPTKSGFQKHSNQQPAKWATVPPMDFPKTGFGPDTKSSFANTTQGPLTQTGFPSNLPQTHPCSQTVRAQTS